MENKKMAAAMAAVYMAIRTGEEVAAASHELPAPPVSEPSGPTQVFHMNTWGITGRQALMNANTMMQMRMFK